MANLSDITDSKMFGDDIDQRFENIIRQINEHFRLISNEDRTKVTKDDAGTERLLNGYQQGGFRSSNVGIKLSQPGVNVLQATDDQLIWSSDFNVLKIIASGTINPTGRTSSVTLDATNIGYSMLLKIDLAGATEQISNSPFVRFVFNNGLITIDGNQSGLFMNDGTNEVFYDYHAYTNDEEIWVELNLRRTAGSYTFTPSTLFNGGNLYWEISNQSYPPAGGAGGGGAGDGKFYYLDTISYDINSATTSALASTLVEFTGGTYKYFPRPTLNISGFVNV